MDGASRAAAGLLVALGRAVERFEELDHPFARREPFSYVRPGGVVAGVHLVLPDGRMVRFAVSIEVMDGAGFLIGGEVLAEDEPLVEPASVVVAEVWEALEVLDRTVHEVVSPGRQIMETLIEEIAES